MAKGRRCGSGGVGEGCISKDASHQGCHTSERGATSRKIILTYGFFLMSGGNADDTCNRAHRRRPHPGRPGTSCGGGGVAWLPSLHHGPVRFRPWPPLLLPPCSLRVISLSPPPSLFLSLSLSLLSLSLSRSVSLLRSMEALCIPARLRLLCGRAPMDAAQHGALAACDQAESALV